MKNIKYYLTILICLFFANQYAFSSETSEDKSAKKENMFTMAVSGGMGFDFVNNNRNLLVDMIFGAGDIDFRINASINILNDKTAETKNSLSWDILNDKIVNHGIYRSSINFGVGTFSNNFFSVLYVGIAQDMHYRNISDDNLEYHDQVNFSVIKAGDNYLNISAELGYKWNDFLISISGSISYEEFGIKLGYYLN